MNRSVKEFARSLARKWRVDLVRTALPLLDHPEGQLKFGLEYAIAHFLLARDSITIVQVGANDGQTHDPLNAILRLNKCAGILLEPQPEVFLRLRETYKNHPQLTLVNAAISEADGTKTLYCLGKNAPGPAWARGLASFDREHLMKHDGFVPNIDRYIEAVSVECITFDSLFRRFPVGQVDLLQIDTEGYDAEVLRLFNVTMRRPSIINFEHRHLPETTWNECVNTLLGLGYQVAVIGQDTLGYLSSNTPAE